MNPLSDEMDRLLLDEASPDEREALAEAWEAAGVLPAGPRMDPGRAREIANVLRARTRSRRAPRFRAGFALAVAAVVVIATITVLRLFVPVLHTTPVGGVAEIALRDGSTVTLAPGSRLTVPGLASGSRTVRLDGEAWFAVVRDGGRPFVLETHDARVTVLGTRFVVRAWSGPSRPGTVVYVEDGSVALEASGDLRLIEAGESAGVRQGEVGEAPDFGPATAMAWLSGDFVFRNEPLERVADEVGRRFGVRVTLGAGADPQRRVTAAFRRPADAVEVVRDLATSLGLGHVATPDGFQLEGLDRR